MLAHGGPGRGWARARCVSPKQPIGMKGSESETYHDSTLTLEASWGPWAWGFTSVLTETEGLQGGAHEAQPVHTETWPTFLRHWWETALRCLGPPTLSSRAPSLPSVSRAQPVAPTCHTHPCVPRSELTPPHRIPLDRACRGVSARMTWSPAISTASETCPTHPQGTMQAATGWSKAHLSGWVAGPPWCGQLRASEGDPECDGSWPQYSPSLTRSRSERSGCLPSQPRGHSQTGNPHWRKATLASHTGLKGAWDLLGSSLSLARTTDCLLVRLTPRCCQ